MTERGLLCSSPPTDTRGFDPHEARCISSRRGWKLRATSVTLGWRNLFVSSQTEIPEEVDYGSARHHLVVVHRNGPARVSLRMGGRTVVRQVEAGPRRDDRMARSHFGRLAAVRGGRCRITAGTQDAVGAAGPMGPAGSARQAGPPGSATGNVFHVVRQDVCENNKCDLACNAGTKGNYHAETSDDAPPASTVVMTNAVLAGRVSMTIVVIGMPDIRPTMIHR